MRSPFILNDVRFALMYGLSPVFVSRFWHQFGGHLKVVESNMCGITWGISNCGTAFVYTGGYGGGFFKGMATSHQGIHTMRSGIVIRRRVYSMAF